MAELVEIFNSKQFKALQKCTLEKCPKFKKNLEKQQELIERIAVLAKNIATEKDLKTKSKMTLELLKLGSDLSKANSSTDELLCKIKECSKEFAEVQKATQQMNITRMKKLEKLLKAFV
jgi:hypothetical protein